MDYLAGAGNKNFHRTFSAHKKGQNGVQVKDTILRNSLNLKLQSQLNCKKNRLTMDKVTKTLHFLLASFERARLKSTTYFIGMESAKNRVWRAGMDSERRIAKRHLVTVPLHSECALNGSLEDIKGITVNMSDSGLCFFTYSCLPAGLGLKMTSSDIWDAPKRLPCSGAKRLSATSIK